jgi:hypothetical protein
MKTKKEQYHEAFRFMLEAAQVAMDRGKEAQELKDKPEYEAAKQRFEEALKVYNEAMERTNTCRSAAYQEVFDSIVQ